MPLDDAPGGTMVPSNSRTRASQPAMPSAASAAARIASHGRLPGSLSAPHSP